MRNRCEYRTLNISIQPEVCKICRTFDHVYPGPSHHIGVRSPRHVCPVSPQASLLDESGGTEDFSELLCNSRICAPIPEVSTCVRLSNQCWRGVWLSVTQEPTCQRRSCTPSTIAQLSGTVNKQTHAISHSA